MNGLEELLERLSPCPAGRMLIGLSGGADSVALLHLVLLLRDRGHAAPEAIHVNHGLRGNEADGDEAFVKALCRERKVPLHVRRLSLNGRKDENSAREARYEAFRQCLAQTGIHQLVLAHQRDDQAETFLLHLLRGAGPSGLGGMRPSETRDGYRLLRPMLGLTGEELRDALRREGIPWREDRTNAQDDYARNRIRHRLLPEMESLFPGAASRMARTALLLGEEEDDRQERAAAFLQAQSGGDWIRTEPLQALSRAGRAAVLRRWWETAGPEMEERQLDFNQTRALEELTEAPEGRTVNLPGGWRARKGRAHVHLLSPAADAPDPAPVRGKRTEFGAFTLEIRPGGQNPGDGKTEQEVPAGFTEGCEIRTRRPGDRIHPFGMRGEKSLQDYLTDRKVDRAWRDRIPLLCRGREVLLVAGVGAGRIPSWEEAPDRIRLVWRGPMPWYTERSKV